MILTKEVEIKIWSSNFKHFTDLGYKNLKKEKIIKIPVEYLQKNSHVKVEVKCDGCGKEKEIPYVKYLQNINKYNIYTCSQKCAHDVGKNKQTSLKNYGVEYTFQSEEIKNKSKQTKLEKYNDENYNNREKYKQTCLDNFGVENLFQLEDIKEKGNQTKLEKYGNENYNNIEQAVETYNNKSEKEKQEISNKRKESYHNKSEKEKQDINVKIETTFLNKYGVKNVFQNKDIKELSKQTKKEKYGNENFNNSKQTKQTNLEKYGVKNVSQVLNIHNKKIQTSLKNYGVEYPLQNIEIFNKQQKNKYKFKDYILPSGKVVKIQGFENLALDILLKIYNENDLLIKGKDIENKIGKIWYINDIGKKRRYYPDIYLISENKIIEVKSDYTFKYDKEKNLLKEQRCLEMNMKFEFMVFNNKKQLLTEKEIRKLI